jgi:MFS family permease
MISAFGELSLFTATDIPSRLDRLPWGRFHTTVVLALGITWILDGLEVTLAGSVAGALQASPKLAFTDTEVGAGASAYLAGAVVGALIFGWLTDLWGRRRLFFMTLGLYLLATAATALAQNAAEYWTFRLLTGAGIGGEYAAINSAIQELVPARFRGRIDLAIGGSFWLGALLGSLATSLFLAPGRFPPDVGWRLAFGVGAVLGLVILVFRRSLPESPRWLLTRGRLDEAEQIIVAIEHSTPGSRLAEVPITSMRLEMRKAAGVYDLVTSLFQRYPRRALLGLILMVAQAFFYNAIFFTFALVLGKFYGVAPAAVGLYLVPFSLTNFAGPLALGWLFDVWGRRQMIVATFALSGVLLAGTAIFFDRGALTAFSLTAALSGVFFVASPAASSAYLTISETFPLEVRALAIAVFYAFGTAIGGVGAPWVFGRLIQTGRPAAVSAGYAFGAVLMVTAAVAAWRLGLATERRSLEDIAPPLGSAANAE